MLDQKPRSSGTPLLTGHATSAPARQQRLMSVALVLLLTCLASLLYRDRDFWFPAGATASSTQQFSPAAEQQQTTKAQVPTRTGALESHKKSHARTSAQKTAPAMTDPPVPPTTITRTILPPLEVEVVAGDARQTVRPRTNSVRVELESPKSASNSAPALDGAPPPGTVSTNAAERAHISRDTAPLVTESIQPEYPLLARQMKVQGAVILQALIGRDGLIQDLRVLSGPPILANAAREAVRQWHFKPHVEGTQAVETWANITVNFTISTN